MLFGVRSCIRRGIILLAMAGVMVGSMTGCGGDDDTDPNPETLIFDSNLSLSENVDNYINALVDQDKGGIAIGVVDQGVKVFGKGYGLANIDSNTPMSTETPVYLASVSKQFFATGIMVLVQQGMLSLHDDVSVYFPEFPETWPSITAHHLLSHQSGMPDYFRALQQDELIDITNTQVLDWAVQNNLNFAPGTQFRYSNTGYVLLSLLIERVTQMSIETFMQTNVFGVAGLDNTVVYDESKPMIPGRAIGYAPNGSLLDYHVLTTGGGGLFSTVDDMLAWSQALDDALVIDAPRFELLTTPNRNGYGYGWFIGNINGEPSISHSGGLQGYRTLLVKQQGKDRTIVMLSNSPVNWHMDLARKIDAFLR